MLSSYARAEHAEGELLILFKSDVTESQRTDFENNEVLVFLSEIPVIKVRLVAFLKMLTY